jgi:uncharacterized protein (TIGR00255 family)
MITSMTGFASVTREYSLATVGVTLKAVNHRYLDVQVRAPQVLGPFESRFRAIVQRSISRGRVEMTVSVQFRQAPTLEVELNAPLVSALAEAMNRARDAGLVAGPLSPGDLLRFPQGLSIRELGPGARAEDADNVKAIVEETIEAAVADLNGMRAHEGRLLRADLDARRAALGEAIGRIADEAKQGSTSLQERLARRVSELALEASVDPALIAQEIVKAVGRSDISEELVRFQAHLDHWTALADAPEPCGRKLDFLLQEMNREVNTIGAKAEGARVGELIVHVKAELEKMREQVQNVE